MSNIVPEEALICRNKVQENALKRTVLVIVTGGTICMTRGGVSDSLRPAPLAQRLRQMSDLSDTFLPHFDLLEWPDLIDSSDINLEHWVQMVTDIERVSN